MSDFGEGYRFCAQHGCTRLFSNAMHFFFITPKCICSNHKNPLYLATLCVNKKGQIRFMTLNIYAEINNPLFMSSPGGWTPLSSALQIVAKLLCSCLVCLMQSLCYMLWMKKCLMTSSLESESGLYVCMYVCIFSGGIYHNIVNILL